MADAFEVPADGARPADGSDSVIGTYSAPNPGAQPGEVSEQPLTANSAADPDPQKAPEVPAEDKVLTADDPDPEASAKGSTDPAVHNPRGPFDAGAKVTVDEPTNVDYHIHNRNAHRGVPTGPAHTQHSRPVRRGEV